jgi:hypothetical protein
MDSVIWLGTGISLVGVAGLVACVVIAARAKRAALSDAELRAQLKKVVAFNMAALLISAMGLMFVIAGIMLG